MTQKILLVEDCDELRLCTKAAFEIYGCEVFEASHGMEALEILETNAMNLVISDYRMPLMTGFELLLEVRERWPQLPFIILSGSPKIDEVDWAKAGVTEVIKKPFFSCQSVLARLKGRI